jgi:D-glycero-beta-D-manno-heptose-7-phosphate kinase
MSQRRVRAIVRRFGRSRIMVVGDCIVDEYLWGDVYRISPEAPVPVVQVDRESLRLGGAANVAQNLRSLGVTPLLVSVCGADANGTRLRSLLAQSLCTSEGIFASHHRPTTIKTRVIARHQQIVRADREVCEDLTPNERARLGERFKRWLPKVRGVIISDYSKGVVSRPFVEDVRNKCKKAGVFVAADPKQGHFDLYKGVDIITPNLKEAHEALGLTVAHRSDREIQDMGWKILDQLELRYLLITLSERGMALFQRDGRRFDHLPTVAQKVFDVTGAGDTVISVFTAAFTCGASPVEAAFIANHAAGIVIGELGTASVDAKTLCAACAQ